MKKCITAFLTLCFFSSGILCCLPDPLLIEGIPAVQSQIVVSSQMLPNGSLVVALTKTFGVLDVSNDSDRQYVLEQLAISDAIVTVTGPRGTDTLTQRDRGIYFSVALVLIPGETYSLHVNSPTMGMVTASTAIMEAVRFETVVVDRNKHGRSGWAHITYSAVDPPGQNYYLLTVQKVQRNNLDKNIFTGSAFTHLVDDRNFNGQAFSEQFDAVPGDYAKGDTIAVSISNIGKTYYDFMKLRLDNSRSLVGYLGEPVNYPSNVIGGQGFFNLHLYDFRLFTIKE